MNRNENNVFVSFISIMKYGKIKFSAKKKNKIDFRFPLVWNVGTDVHLPQTILLLFLIQIRFQIHQTFTAKQKN